MCIVACFSKIITQWVKLDDHYNNIRVHIILFRVCIIVICSVNAPTLKLKFGLYSLQLSFSFTLREISQVIILRCSFQQPI